MENKELIKNINNERPVRDKRIIRYTLPSVGVLPLRGLKIEKYIVRIVAERKKVKEKVISIKEEIFIFLVFSIRKIIIPKSMGVKTESIVKSIPLILSNPGVK